MGHVQPGPDRRRATGAQDGTRASLPAGRNRSRRRFPEGHRASRRRRAWRCGNHVPGVCAEAAVDWRSRSTGRPRRAGGEHEPCRRGRPSIHRRVRIQPVQGNVYMLAGAGGNIAVQVGKQGVLLVDTGSGTDDRQSPRGHPSVVGPADSFHPQYARASRSHRWQRGDREGRKPRGGGLVVAVPTGTGASVIAHEAVLLRDEHAREESHPLAGRRLADRSRMRAICRMSS